MADARPPPQYVVSLNMLPLQIHHTYQSVYNSKKTVNMLEVRVMLLSILCHTDGPYFTCRVKSHKTVKTS